MQGAYDGTAEAKVGKGRVGPGCSALRISQQVMWSRSGAGLHFCHFDEMAGARVNADQGLG